MSTPLSATVCSVHPDRPASFRCQSCREFYCAECVTEHENRYTCAACLRKQSGEPEEAGKGKRLALPLMPLVHFAIAIGVCWVLFYFLAQFLVGIPDQFHDGTIWE